MASYFPVVCISFVLILVALASDPNPLQDFCVSIPNSPVMVNGFACKDPKLVQANDFLFSGLHLAGNTSNAVGSRVTPVSVAQILGLNTLGISLARLDYASWGLNPPHTHPRATEILTILECTLLVGFVTSNPKNRLLTKVLQKGDNAVAIAALSSQNPGVMTIRNAAFGSKPAIASDILAKAFQVDGNIINQIQSRF
ncbi:unnamed protein product [Coffea canephora]|uniref:Cupin type-1 domain-containing protein n=1 Tax=Coffea canephora TaxID=49390 RepID=A0A068UWC4_COFCA|nr:unnamed protein product [Coffea canephora]